MQADHTLGMRHDVGELAHRERRSIRREQRLGREHVGERKEDFSFEFEAFGNGFYGDRCLAGSWDCVLPDDALENRKIAQAPCFAFQERKAAFARGGLRLDDIDVVTGKRSH